MYNATVTRIDKNTKEVICTFVAEVIEIDGRLQMLRGNGNQYTGYEGKIGKDKETGKEVAVYDLYLRLTYPDSEFKIVQDDCEGYKNLLKGLALPPSYR